MEEISKYAFSLGQKNPSHFDFLRFTVGRFIQRHLKRNVKCYQVYMMFHVHTVFFVNYFNLFYFF
ncbi:hypothetical protein PGB90_005999 [Kerria lacca]